MVGPDIVELFPTTGILDGLDPWLEENWTGEAYTASEFGPDCEARVTIDTKPEGDFIIAVYARCSVDLANGYAVVMMHKPGVTDDVGIFVIEGGNYTQLGDLIPLEFSDGDGLGICCTGPSIRAEWCRAGAWQEVGLRVDEMYGEAGYLGLLVEEGECSDFGGGDYVPVASVGTVHGPDVSGGIVDR